MNTRLLGGTALAALLSCAMAAPALAQSLDYSSLLVFGDSLSDTDNLKNLSPASRPGAPYVNGRFSNGPVWAETYAANTGTTLNSRAYGGARATRTSPIDLTAQVSAYLATNSAIPSDRLVGIWIGGNDYIAVLTEPQANPSAAAQAAVTATATAVATQAGRLQAAGAKNFVLMNLPPLGNIPLTSGLSAADKASANTVSDLHAAAISSVAANLRAQGANAAIVDVNGLFRDILARPAAYGFANTTIPCYAPVGANGALVATGACATSAGTAGTVFFDALHPTQAAHAVVAQFVEGTLSANYEAPAANNVATELAQRLFDLANQGVGSRMAGVRTGQGSVNMTSAQAGTDGRYGLYTFGAYLDGERKGSTGRYGYDYDGFNVGIGADYQVDDHVVAGLAFSYGKADLTTDEDLARINGKAYNITTYVTAAADALWLDGYMSFSFDRYDLDRVTKFSPYPVAGGDTKGTTFGGGGTVGYAPNLGGFTAGPFLGLRYAKTRIEGYAENGGGPLALAWDDWNAESLVSSLGVQLSAAGHAIVPQLRIAYEHEFANDGRLITGRFANRELVTGEAGAGKRDRLAVGLQAAGMAADNVMVSIGYDGRVEGGRATDHAFTARVKVGF